MIINGFNVKGKKVKYFSFDSLNIDSRKIISLLFIGALGFGLSDLWYVMTASGLELSGGKDMFWFLDSVRLGGEI